MVVLLFVNLLPDSLQVSHNDLITKDMCNLLECLALCFREYQEDNYCANQVGTDEQRVVLVSNLRERDWRDLVEYNVDENVGDDRYRGSLGADSHGHYFGNVDVMDRVVAEGIACRKVSSMSSISRLKRTYMMEKQKIKAIVKPFATMLLEVP